MRCSTSPEAEEDGATSDVKLSFTLPQHHHRSFKVESGANSARDDTHVRSLLLLLLAHRAGDSQPTHIYVNTRRSPRASLRTSALLVWWVCAPSRTPEEPDQDADQRASGPSTATATSSATASATATAGAFIHGSGRVPLTEVHLGSCNGDNMSNDDIVIYGERTREFHAAWVARLGAAETRTRSMAMLQGLFNDVELFPSKSQIFEMVQCAHECSNHVTRLTSTTSSSEGASDRSSSGSGHSEGGRRGTVSATAAAAAAAAFVDPDDDVDGDGVGLTFGEFCLFTIELKKYYENDEKKRRRRRRRRRQCQDSSSLLLQSPGSTPPTATAAKVSATGAGDQQASSKRDGCIQHHHHRRGNELLRPQKSSTSAYDVFLGGSCNPTTWRQDAAIPYLKSHSITFYNPQQSNWVPEMIELEHQAKQTSQLLLFVLDEKTRNVVSMVEVAYLAGARKRLVVVLGKYPFGHTICGEKMGEIECRELNGAMNTVHDLVERQGLPVFKDLKVALSCAVKVLKEGVRLEDLGLQDCAQPVRLAHLQIGDRLVRLHEAFDALDTSRSGKISLADLRMAFRIHVHRDLTQTDLRKILAAHDPSFDAGDKKTPLPLDRAVVDFDHFCCIVAEFKRARAKEGKAARVIHSVTRPLSRLAAAFKRESSGLPRQHSPPQSPPPQTQPPRSPSFSSHLRRRNSQIRDVYLGGSSGGRWRERLAIPQLKKHGLTYFSSAAAGLPSAPSRAGGRLIPLEAAAAERARVLLFVISGSSRSVGAMCEAAYHIGRSSGSGGNGASAIVLCVQKISDGTELDGSGQDAIVSKAALKDYNRGRAYLSDIANREGVPVFEEVAEAIECILQKCKSLK